MTEYTLEVSNRQIITILEAIVQIDVVAHSMDAELDPPASVVIDALMNQLPDEIDPDQRTWLTLDAVIVSAIHSAAATSLKFGNLPSDEVRQDLEVWQSCTQAYIKSMKGTEGGHANLSLN